MWQPFRPPENLRLKNARVGVCANYMAGNGVRTCRVRFEIYLSHANISKKGNLGSSGVW